MDTETAGTAALFPAHGSMAVGLGAPFWKGGTSQSVSLGLSQGVGRAAFPLGTRGDYGISPLLSALLQSLSLWSHCFCLFSCSRANLPMSGFDLGTVMHWLVPALRSDSRSLTWSFRVPGNQTCSPAAVVTLTRPSLLRLGSFSGAGLHLPLTAGARQAWHGEQCCEPQRAPQWNPSLGGRFGLVPLKLCPAPLPTV